MSFEILFPFGLWVFELGWLLSTTVSWCEGVPVPLKMKVGAVRQSILVRVVWLCVGVRGCAWVCVGVVCVGVRVCVCARARACVCRLAFVSWWRRDTT